MKNRFKSEEYNVLRQAFAGAAQNLRRAATADQRALLCWSHFFRKLVWGNLNESVRDPNDHRLLCVDYLAGYTAKTSLCLGNCKHLHESGHSGDQIMVTCEQKSKSSPPALSPNFLADRHRIHGIRGESKAKQNPAS